MNKNLSKTNIGEDGVKEKLPELPAADFIMPAKSDEGIDKGYVRLPVGLSEFGTFIRSLLGRPQTITKYYRGAYEITQNDVRNFHELIMQRIQQQNDSQFIQFTAQTIYSDSSNVTVNSLEEFLTYKEVRPIISEAIHLEWSYLVQFQDKDAPEKQKITIAFSQSIVKGIIYLNLTRQHLWRSNQSEVDIFLLRSNIPHGRGK